MLHITEMIRILCSSFAPDKAVLITTSASTIHIYQYPIILPIHLATSCLAICNVPFFNGFDEYNITNTQVIFGSTPTQTL